MTERVGSLTEKPMKKALSALALKLTAEFEKKLRPQVLLISGGGGYRRGSTRD